MLRNSTVLSALMIQVALTSSNRPRRPPGGDKESQGLHRNRDWNSDSSPCHNGLMFKAFSKTFWLLLAVVVVCGLGVVILWAFVLK